MMSLLLPTRAVGECMCVCGHNRLPVPRPCPHCSCWVHTLPGTLLAPGCHPGEGDARSSAFPKASCLECPFLPISVHLCHCPISFPSHSHIHVFPFCLSVSLQKGSCYLFQRERGDENQAWVGAQSWEALLKEGPGHGNRAVGDSQS